MVYFLLMLPTKIQCEGLPDFYKTPKILGAYL